MELINFDNPNNERKSKHFFLVPDCHYMIIGQTGAGKTNLLLNLLLQFMNYNSCKIYTINADQDKYQLLNEYNKLFDTEDIDNMIQIATPEDVLPVEELDNDTNKVIIFDVSRNLLPIYRKYFNLIGYRTYYLSGDR